MFSYLIEHALLICLQSLWGYNLAVFLSQKSCKFYHAIKSSKCKSHFLIVKALAEDPTLTVSSLTHTDTHTKAKDKTLTSCEYHWSL